MLGDGWYGSAGWYTHTWYVLYCMVFDRKRWDVDEGEEPQLVAWPAVL